MKVLKSVLIVVGLLALAGAAGSADRSGTSTSDAAAATADSTTRAVDAPASGDTVLAPDSRS